MMISKLVLAIVGAAGLAAAQNVISIPVPLDRSAVSPAHSGLSEFGKQLKGKLDDARRGTREFVSIDEVRGPNQANSGAHSGPSPFRPRREARRNRGWAETASLVYLPFTTKRNDAGGAGC